MGSGFSTLRVGTEVRGADGHRVGTIKDIQESVLLVHRTLQPTVRVPVNAIHEITETEVVIALTAGEVDELYWLHAGEDMNVDLHGIYKYDYVNP